MTGPHDPNFDPYYRWLGIPKAHRPPTYYQLLGLAPGESDPEVIDESSLRQSRHIRDYQLGPHAALCTRLLNEIAQARKILMNPQKKKEYDLKLSAEGNDQIQARAPAVLAAPLAEAAGTPFDDLESIDGVVAKPPIRPEDSKISRKKRKTRIDLEPSPPPASPWWRKRNALLGMGGALGLGLVAIFAIVFTRPKPAPPPAPPASPALVAKLEKGKEGERITAVQGLAKLSAEAPTFLPSLKLAFQADKSGKVRSAIVVALTELGTQLPELGRDGDIRALLTRALRDSEAEVRWNAVASLAAFKIDGPTARTALEAALNDVHPTVRCKAVSALAQISADAPFPAIQMLLSDSEPQVQRDAFAALKQIGPQAVRAAVVDIARMCRNGPQELKKPALTILDANVSAADAQNSALVTALHGASRDSDAEVQKMASALLVKIGAPKESNDRKVAQWVLKNSGTVTVWKNGIRASVGTINALPQDVQLTRIYIKAQPTEAELALVSDLRTLEILDFAMYPATDQDVALLGDLPELHSVIMQQSRITDAGLLTLKRYPNLKTLTLKNAAITDQSVATFEYFKSLKTLNISDTKITSEGVAQIQKALPTCKIISKVGT